MKQLSIISTSFMAAVLVLLTSFALYSFSYNRSHHTLTHGDWTSQVNGQYVKIDFDGDGVFEVNIPGSLIEKDGLYSTNHQTITFKQSNGFGTPSKSYKFSYSFNRNGLVLKPASERDAALFGATTTQPIIFHV